MSRELLRVCYSSIIKVISVLVFKLFLFIPFCLTTSWFKSSLLDNFIHVLCLSAMGSDKSNNMIVPLYTDLCFPLA